MSEEREVKKYIKTTRDVFWRYVWYWFMGKEFGIEELRVAYNKCTGQNCTRRDIGLKFTHIDILTIKEWKAKKAG